MTTSQHAVEYQLELSPGTSVYIALFRNVRNVDDLKSTIAAGQIDAVLLSPKMILDPFQVLVAANKAMHTQNRGLKMTTRNVNSEVLYNLSHTKNISTSFRRFGVSKTDIGLLVATLGEGSAEKMNAVERVVKGEMMPLSGLKIFTDETLIKRLYQVEEEELSVCSLLDAVVSRMATKEVLS